MAELQRRQVDRDPQPRPPRGLRASRVQDPLAERQDQAGLVGLGDEVLGIEQAALGVQPADQRLDPHDGPRRGVDLRLVDQLKLALLQAALEVPLERAAQAQRHLHARLEHAEGGAPLVLGAIERDAGALDHLVARLAAADQGDADAGASDHLLAVEIERLGEARQHTARQQRCAVRLLLAVLHDRELVAADARQAVASTDARRQAPRAGLEQQIADRGPKRVVDLAKAVEIDAQQRPRLAAAAGQRSGVIDLVAKLRAVGKVGQRVETGEVRARGFGGDDRGDVRAGAAIAAKAAVAIEERPAADLNVVDGAGIVGDLEAKAAKRLPAGELGPVPRPGIVAASAVARAHAAWRAPPGGLAPGRRPRSGAAGRPSPRTIRRPSRRNRESAPPPRCAGAPPRRSRACGERRRRRSRSPGRSTRVNSVSICQAGCWRDQPARVGSRSTNISSTIVRTAAASSTRASRRLAELPKIRTSRSFSPTPAAVPFIPHLEPLPTRPSLRPDG